ncbi:MAG TPA: hypothetical protein EYP49_20450, partial [Anaerolineae bacterium]|nr:hypothetical protein [Anaerolineae bacterium]
GLPIDVEAVGPGTAFHTAITVDEYSFRGRAARQLGWRNKRRWLERLAYLGKGHAEERLIHEIRYHQERGPAPVHAFYTHRLKELRESLGPNEFLVQIGWGAGWESKTFGSGMLRQDDWAFERLLKQYRMTKGCWQPGDPFPKSRHLVLDPHGRPAEPLGWVKVRLEGLGEAVAAQPEEAARPEKAAGAPGQQTGRVARFFDQRGYGFIRPDAGGAEVFVHANDVTNADALYDGQRVAYDVELGDKGPRAVRVTVLS